MNTMNSRAFNRIPSRQYSLRSVRVIKAHGFGAQRFGPLKVLRMLNSIVLHYAE